MICITNNFLKLNDFSQLNTSLEIEPYIFDYRLRLDEVMKISDDMYETLKAYLKVYEDNGIVKITKIQEPVKETIQVEEIKEEPKEEMKEPMEEAPKEETKKRGKKNLSPN